MIASTRCKVDVIDTRNGCGYVRNVKIEGETIVWLLAGR